MDMKISLATISVVLFVVSLALLGLLTLFEAELTGMPPNIERIISGLLLVLPAAAGAVMGVLSLYRKEPKPWIAIAGILLNAGFALFNLLVLSFSG